MHDLLVPIIEVIDTIIGLFKIAVIAAIIMSWLAMANILNTRSRLVYTIMDTLNRITEPVLRPIRRIMPNTGAFDFSPIVLFLILQLVQSYLAVLARDI